MTADPDNPTDWSSDTTASLQTKAWLEFNHFNWEPEKHQHDLNNTANTYLVSINRTSFVWTWSLLVLLSRLCSCFLKTQLPTLLQDPEERRTDGRIYVQINSLSCKGIQFDTSVWAVCKKSDKIGPNLNRMIELILMTSCFGWVFASSLNNAGSPSGGHSRYHYALDGMRGALTHHVEPNNSIFSECEPQTMYNVFIFYQQHAQDWWWIRHKSSCEVTKMHVYPRFHFCEPAFVAMKITLKIKLQKQALWMIDIMQQHAGKND